MFIMPAESTTFRRARSAAQKHQRREAILAAARGLGAKRGVRCVTLGDIAGEVGLAKSNVLRYFGTREEIFLQLTVDGWRDWTQAVRDRLDTCEPDPQRVAEVLADTISQLPLFCDLLAHTAAHLEHNVSLAAVRSMKLGIRACIAELAALLRASLPQLGEQGGPDLLQLTTMLAGSLWQVAHPSDALAVLYEQDPELIPAHLEFVPTLTRLTARFIHGFTQAKSDAERAPVRYPNDRQSTP
jgi:AcrR family transcriptional regulator